MDMDSKNKNYRDLATRIFPKKQNWVFIFGGVILVAVLIVLLANRNGQTSNQKADKSTESAIAIDSQRRLELNDGIRQAFLEHYKNQSEFKAFSRDERVVDWILEFYSEHYYNQMIKVGRKREPLREYKGVYYAGSAPEYEGESGAQVIYESVLDTVFCELYLHGSLADKSGNLNIGQWRIIRKEDGQYTGELSFSVSRQGDRKDAKIQTGGWGFDTVVYLSGVPVDGSRVMISKEKYGASSTLEKYVNDQSYGVEALRAFFEGGDFYLFIDDYSIHFTNETKGYQAISGSIDALIDEDDE